MAEELCDNGRERMSHMTLAEQAGVLAADASMGSKTVGCACGGTGIVVNSFAIDAPDVMEQAALIIGEYGIDPLANDSEVLERVLLICNVMNKSIADSFKDAMPDVAKKVGSKTAAVEMVTRVNLHVAKFGRAWAGRYAAGKKSAQNPVPAASV